MPKKGGQNGFAFFMYELKDKQGRNIRSMAEAAEVAAPLWAKMSREQRRPYEDQAKRTKNNRGKMTSTGRDVELLQQEEEAQQESIAQMREDINVTMDALHEAGVIDKTLFFIIHINNFCYCESQNRWYPAEIACVGFSLRDGVAQPENVFHKLIKPGMLPIGYGSSAKLHASQTHQLEVPHSDENNCEGVFMELIQFLEARLKAKKLIVYANETKLQMISDVIEMWCADFDIPLNTVSIYNLQYFFTALKNKCAGDIVWHSDTFSSRELEKDLFDYCSKLACELHEISSLQIHCSRSIVIRSAYIICDNCCKYLNIKLINGVHVPENSKTAGIVQKVQSAPNSAVPSKKTVSKSSRDDDSSTIKSYGRSEWETQSNSSMLDDFPTLGSSKMQIPRDTWDKFNPNVGELSTPLSYASSMGGVRTESNARYQNSQSNIISGVDNLSLLDSETDFPHIGRGRGIRKAKLARGRGNAYDKKYSN